MNSSERFTLHVRPLVQVFRLWLPLAGACAALFLMEYLGLQQALRMGANDPQIQLAEDLAARLAAGSRPADLLQRDPVDLAQSLSPGAIVFDKDGTPIASDAELSGTIPRPPAGIFNFLRTAQEAEDRFTWQPQPGVRLAAVMVRFHGSADGFVLITRSLREVEKRIANVGQLFLLGFVGTVLGTFALVYLTAVGGV